MLTEIPAGVESGWHKHPGEEVGYILAGTVRTGRSPCKNKTNERRGATKQVRIALARRPSSSDGPGEDVADLFTRMNVPARFEHRPEDR